MLSSVEVLSKAMENGYGWLHIPLPFLPRVSIFEAMNRFLPVLAALLAATLSAGAAPKVPALPALIDEKALVALLGNKDAKALLIDVRTAEEFSAGYIPGAILLPFDEIAAKFKEADKGRPIVVYCRSGRRSAIARETLLSMGYTNVADFGAYTNWKGKLAKK
jgi:phage shock protein E